MPADSEQKADKFQSFNKWEYDGYNSYVLKEWDLFVEKDIRYDAFLEAVNGHSIGRVLDIGCGAGQEMLPFVANGAFGLGLDYVPEAGQVGKVKYAEEGLADKVAFLRGSGDALPLADGSVEAVICRGAIMFMDNDRALGEFARVLKKGGYLFLMFQAPAYYWWKFRNGLKTGNPLSSIHAARVLYAGTLFRLTGRQPRGRLTAGGEVFETRKYIIETCADLGLEKTGEMPDTNPQTPFLVFRKGDEA